MEKLIITILIMPIIVLSAYVFSRRKYFDFSAFELFIFFFTLYLVLIPLDHLFGFHIREHESFLSLNYDKYNSDASIRIIQVIVLYYIFFISVLFGYLKLKFNRDVYRFRKPLDVNYSRLYIPSVKFLLIFNTSVLTFYIYKDIEVISQNMYLASSLKQVRAQVGINQDAMYRAFSFISNLFVSFNTLVMIVAKNRKITKVSLLSIVIMALYMGDRSTLFIAFFIALLVHKPKINLTKTSLIVSMVLVTFIYFKPVFNFVVADLTQETHATFFESLNQIDSGFSRIEGLSPFEVIQTVSDGDFEYRYGETYLLTPLMKALPSFIYKSKAESLAVEFKKQYAPNSDGFFGFSPIAEALINFGILGLLISGILFGSYLYFLGKIRHGIFYYVNVMIIIRFLRVDFASLFKRYFVVELTAMLISILLLGSIFFIITLLSKKNSSSMRNELV